MGIEDRNDPRAVSAEAMLVHAAKYLLDSCNHQPDPHRDCQCKKALAKAVKTVEALWE